MERRKTACVYHQGTLLHSILSNLSVKNVYVRVCVLLHSRGKASSCTDSNSCLRNRQDLCCSELESSRLLLQSSHVVLHGEGNATIAWCLARWMCMRLSA